MLFEEAGCAGGLMTNRNKSPDLKLSQTMPNSGSLKLEHLYLFCRTTGLRKGLVCVQRACLCPMHVQLRHKVRPGPNKAHKHACLQQPGGVQMPAPPPPQPRL